MISNLYSTLTRAYQSRIRFRIFALIANLMLLASVAMGIMAWAATEIAADSFINQRLENVKNQWIRDSLSQGQFTDLKQPYLTLYYHQDPKLPSYLQHLEQSGMEELESRHLHIATFLSPFNDELLHLVYSPNSDPNIPNYGQDIGRYVLYMVGMLMVIGLVGAHMLAGYFSAPILKLKQQAIMAGKVPPMNRNDELGSVSREFDHAFRRVSQFIEREKNFTRFASHELRTPVHTIKGATELLLLTEQDKKKQRIISRIENANRTMQSLIETFLLLGREAPTPEPREQWQALVANAIKQHGYLIEKKPITFKHTFHCDTFCHQPSFAAVALANMIKNAFSYADSHIYLSLSANRLLIVNDINHHSKGGFGHGTEITTQICQTTGWRYWQKTTHNTCYTLLYYS